MDTESQLIVAHGVTNKASDVKELALLVEQIQQNTGRQNRELSTVAGYFSEDNLIDL